MKMTLENIRRASNSLENGCYCFQFVNEISDLKTELIAIRKAFQIIDICQGLKSEPEFDSSQMLNNN